MSHAAFQSRVQHLVQSFCLGAGYSQAWIASWKNVLNCYDSRFREVANYEQLASASVFLLTGYPVCPLL